MIRNEHEHEHVNADIFWLILCDSHPLLGCSQITRGSLTTRIAISSSVIFIIVGIFRIGENSLWKLATMLKCQNHGWSLLQKCLMRKYVAIIEVRNLKQCLTTTYSVFVAFFQTKSILIPIFQSVQISRIKLRMIPVTRKFSRYAVSRDIFL